MSRASASPAVAALAVALLALTATATAAATVAATPLLPEAQVATEVEVVSRVDFEEGDAAHSSSGMPHIPEPMVFDLVRPLGARRGEFEINVLALQPFAGGRGEYAPEIEYAFADGYAVELEFPFVGTRLDEYKVALQGTLGTLREGRGMHGWQVIGRRGRDDGRRSADLLYLHGQTLGAGWSVLGMVGLRQPDFRDDRVVGLANGTLFFEYSQRLTLGVEINSEIRDSRWGAKLIPQLHYDLGPNSTLQLGISASWLNPGQRGDAGLGGRLIYAF